MMIRPVDNRGIENTIITYQSQLWQYRCELDGYMKQLIQLKAEKAYLQTSANSIQEYLQNMMGFRNEPINEILQSLERQMINFSKRIEVVEDGFIKISHIIFANNLNNELRLSQRLDEANSLQTNDLYESILTPKDIANELKKALIRYKIDEEDFANIVLKIPTQYLSTMLNHPRCWNELNPKAASLYKAIYQWLEEQNNNNNKNIVNNNNNNNNNNSNTNCGTSSSSSGSSNSSNVIASTININQHLHLRQSQSVASSPSNSVANIRLHSKKSKKRLNSEQYIELIKFYSSTTVYPKLKQIEEISKKLDLSVKFVQNWFANKRRRDNPDKTVSKRTVVNCKLNQEQKFALNDLFNKNPHPDKHTIKEFSDKYKMSFGAVCRWFNIKRSTNGKNKGPDDNDASESNEANETNDQVTEYSDSFDDNSMQHRMSSITIHEIDCVKVECDSCSN